MTRGLLQGEGAINRSDPTFLAIELAPDATLRTRGQAGGVRGELPHLAGLDQAAEVLPQLMR
ncbi:MAG TPA: hypothetical protein VNA86_05685, partial [bacterium]|nr:hypothetical protein [bacterium]